METIINEVKDFLIRHQMFYEQIELDQCLIEYLDEMKKGLSEDGSSLPMLPAFVFADEMHVRNKKIISIDAGGTNLRVALVSFNQNGECMVSDMQKYSMPGLNEPITSDEFFETMTRYITPLLSETHQIAISFAYPTEITPSMDGKILRMVKEIKIEGIEGCLLGDCLKKTLYKWTGYECNVYVTNDTVATCLAGISNAVGTGYASYIGLVLGTGINSCYIEKLTNIKKIEVSKGKENMLINTESGNYNRQPRGDIDVLFDQTTADPGHNTLEKMISGGYLGALIDCIIRYSKKEGLFSQAFYEAFEKAAPLEAVNIDAFVRDQDGDNKLAEICRMAKCTDDSIKLYKLIKYIIKRAAKMAVLQLAGAAVKCFQGGGKENVICMTIEGSTYDKLLWLRDEIEMYLREWLKKKYNMYTQVIQVEDAVLKGAATAGLL